MKRRKTKQKKSNFVDKPNKDFEVYKSGAFAGGLMGGVVGLLLGKRIILWIVGGAIAGGYINYEINKEDSSRIGLKKFKDI
jgi:uncharacterized protein YcfJ